MPEHLERDEQRRPTTEADGFFSWQNDFTDPHNQTHTFLSYRNEGACIEHGAYVNAFDFDHITCVEDDGSVYPYSPNTAGGADIVLRDRLGNPQNFTDVTVRGGVNQRIANVLQTRGHLATAGKPTSLRRFDVSGYSGKAVVVDEDATLPPRPVRLRVLDGARRCARGYRTGYNRLRLHRRSPRQRLPPSTAGRELLPVTLRARDGGTLSRTYSSTNCNV